MRGPSHRRRKSDRGRLAGRLTKGRGQTGKDMEERRLGLQELVDMQMVGGRHRDFAGRGWPAARPVEQPSDTGPGSA